MAKKESTSPACKEILETLQFVHLQFENDWPGYPYYMVSDLLARIEGDKEIEDGDLPLETKYALLKRTDEIRHGMLIERNHQYEAAKKLLDEVLPALLFYADMSHWTTDGTLRVKDFEEGFTGDLGNPWSFPGMRARKAVQAIQEASE